MKNVTNHPNLGVYRSRRVGRYRAAVMTAPRTTAEFLGILPADTSAPPEPSDLEMPMGPQVLGGLGDSLFGGAGLAAGVVALEQATGRSAVWMSGQFVSHAGPPETLRFSTTISAQGRTVSQGRVIGSSGEREVISLLGACGSRREDFQGRWMVMPQAVPPEESTPIERFPGLDSIHQHVEVLMASGMFGFTGSGTPTKTSTSLLWARMEGVELDAGALAIIGDYAGSAIGNSIGEKVSASSLDNTIRYVGPVTGHDAGSWVLCESRIEFVGAGFASVTALLWSQAGELLAVASQSMTVSKPRDL